MQHHHHVHHWTTSPGAMAVFFEILPVMRLPGDWIWKEKEEIQAMPPQGISEGEHPGDTMAPTHCACQGQPVQPLVLHIKDCPHPWWGLRVLLYFPLRCFLSSEVAGCWSHWFLWMVPLGTRVCVLQGTWIWQTLYSRGPGMNWDQPWEACFIMVLSDNTSGILLWVTNWTLLSPF